VNTNEVIDKCDEIIREDIDTEEKRIKMSMYLLWFVTV
jgi:hypothetical protein